MRKIRLASLRVCPRTGAAKCGARKLKLEPRAQALLLALIDNRGQVCSKQALIDRVWGHPHLSADTLAVCMHRLRSKLPVDAAAWVQTIPGQGYSLRRPPAGQDRPRLRWLLMAAAILLATGVRFESDTPNSALPGLDPLARAAGLIERHQPQATRRAAAILRAQLRSNPDSAQAHQLLASLYGHKTYSWLDVSRSQAASIAGAHLAQADRIAPSIALQIARAEADFYLARQPQRALERLVEVDTADARSLKAMILASLGQHSQAQRLSADLRGADADWQRAFLAFLAGQHQRSISLTLEAEAHHPRDPYWLLALNQHALGDLAAAAQTWRAYATEHGCVLDNRSGADATFAQLLDEASVGCLTSEIPFHRALWAQAIGDLSLARSLLQQARAEDDPLLVWEDQLQRRIALDS